VQPRLRITLLRALEEFATVLEKRCVGLVAIEVARELVLETDDRRRRAVEIGERGRVLRTRPSLNRRVLADFEPAIAIGQRDAELRVDDRPRRCLRREERKRLRVYKTCHDGEQ